jgi:hypothetical protein
MNRDDDRSHTGQPAASVRISIDTQPQGAPDYVPDLGVLVNARRLLHQSKPSIEIVHVNTATGDCKPNLLSGEPVCDSSGAEARRRSSTRSRTYPSLRVDRDRTPHLALRTIP